MHQSHTPQCTCPISHIAPLCNRNVHTCTFLLQSGALWDTCLMHCGIYGDDSVGIDAVGMPVKQPWRIWVNEAHNSQRTDNTTQTKQTQHNCPGISWDILYMMLTRRNNDDNNNNNNNDSLFSQELLMIRPLQTHKNTSHTSHAHVTEEWLCNGWEGCQKSLRLSSWPPGKWKKE